MKKITLFVLALLIGLCMAATPSLAQFHMAIGPVTGFNFNIHSGSDIQETGTGLGFMIGGEADMSFSPTIGILTRLIFYDNMSGSYSKSGTDPYYGNYSQDYSSSVGYFTIDALFRLKLQRSGLYFIAGPSFGINVEGSYEVSTTIQGQDYGKQKGSLKDMQARFALKVGAGYEIPIARDIDLTPQVTFAYGLTKVQSDVSWRIINIYAGCGVKFRVL